MNLTGLIRQLLMVVTITQGRRIYRPRKWQRPAAGQPIQKGRFITFQELFEQVKIAALTVTAERKAPQTLNRMKNITNGYKY